MQEESKYLLAITSNTSVFKYPPSFLPIQEKRQQQPYISKMSPSILGQAWPNLLKNRCLGGILPCSYKSLKISLSSISSFSFLLFLFSFFYFPFPFFNFSSSNSTADHSEFLISAVVIVSE